MIKNKNNKNIILCFILLLTINLQSEAMTFQRAKNLFSHLCNISGYHVELKLDNATYVNAWVDSPYRVTITQGLLDFCSDAEIVAVMGHEIGHIDRQHYRTVSGSFKQEMDADITGYYYCKKLNYSKQKCVEFMYHIKSIYGNGSGEDGEHPPWTQRIDNVLRNDKK